MGADPQHRFAAVRASLAAVLWGLLLLSQVGPAAATPAASSSARLIYCGWFGNTIPTPAFIAANKTFLETQPFHGLVAYLRNDSTGFNVTTGVMTPTPVSAAAIASVLSPMKGVSFTTLRENFGLIQGSRPPDFYDDWSITVQNFANAALALKDAGLKGIVFDNEQYFSPWGNYPTGVKYLNRTLAEYQVQARLRGRQVMEAMVAQFPGIAVMTLHGPTVSEPKVPTPLFPVWYTANELQGPFFSGMMEGCPAGALNVDGGELYHLRTADQFLQSYNWRKYTHPSDAIDCAFIPPAMRPSWPGKSSIAFGVYDRTFGGAAMDATIVRPTIANALRQADRYVWFYTEGPTFLRPSTQGGATDAWVSAVRMALSDAGVSTTVDPAPAAPSHFAAAPTSATAVDLTWWDMSNNETGFEIERKTGSTGTWSRIMTTGANVSTIDDVGLTGSTTYSYRACAVNSSGPSAYSNEVTVTTPAPPLPVPAAPSQLAAAATSATTVHVTWWDLSSNETGFGIERKTGSGGTWARILTTGANVSTIDDVGLTGSTTYSYRACAVNSSGPSAYSNEVTVTTPAPQLPVPAAPSNLTAAALSATAIRVAWWDLSNNETGFEIERKTGSGGTWARILTTGANVSTLDDLGLAGSTTYSYRSRAVSSSGASAYSNEVTVATPAPPPPGPTAPSNLTAAALSATAIRVAWWDLSNNETGFEIERKTGSAGTWARVLTTATNVSTADNPGLAGGTTYVYRVRAVNGTGPSAYSNEITVTTPAPAAGPVPAAPTHLSIYSLATARISVTWWDMSNNETGFEVERKTGSGGTWARIATQGANVSIHADTTVVSGVLYYYRARAVNGNGASAYTNEISQVAP